MKFAVKHPLMIKTALLLFFAAAASTLHAQIQNPVSWSFSTRKISENVYELQFTATIQKGWHLYSQEQPKDAIVIPTTFTFTRNPLVNLDGKVKEVGKMEKYRDETLDMTTYQYSNKVVFVQKVTVRSKAKTSVTGSVEFQTCDDEKCLPPKTVPFSLVLN